MEIKNITCCICGDNNVPIIFANNAWPVQDGLCCYDCNAWEVIPARVELMYEHVDNEAWAENG